MKKSSLFFITRSTPYSTLRYSDQFQKILYQSIYQFQEESLSNIYNSELYKTLLQKGFFNKDYDICLIGLCDGYQIFKQK